MVSAIPFLGHRDDSDPVALRAGKLVTAAEFIGDVLALSDRLPERQHVINICRDRYHFAVGLASALLRQQITLLPPSQSAQAMGELAADYGSPYLLVDDNEVRDSESIRVRAGVGSSSFSRDEVAYAPDATAVIAFTSGSTGKPLPNRKSWGFLAQGGRSEAARFALTDGSAVAIVGTVPPQHMYGLESTVLMPMQAGLIMHADRPFFTEDVRATLAAIDMDRVLISTPVHLRALLASDVDLPPLRLVVCATAPLADDMARRFEARFGVEVHEVYGFTEAGMVATRRTVNGQQWRLLDGLRMRQAGDSLLVSGGHVPAEVAFSDQIDRIDAEHFVLLGRSADVVNVAGKRTSLGYLDRQLGTLDGVEDAAFFMPDEIADGVTRLMAFAVAPGRTRENVLQMLAQRIDPVFLPRPLYLVDALPRNATGKLPRSELLNLARECAAAVRKRPIVVECPIDPAHPALPGHFPGDPIMPGVVLLDTIIDTAAGEYGFDSAHGGMTIRSAKFLRPVRPGEALRIRLTPGAGHSVRFECSVGDEIAVTGVMAPGQASGA